MRHFDNPLSAIAYRDVRCTFRNLEIHNRPVRWDENGWFWLALQTVWSDLISCCHTPGDRWNGPGAVTDDLSAALAECGVPRSSIRSFGSHTIVTLDNISFVYRAKRYKADGEHLLVAPHITGLPFSKCGHSFIHPFSPLPDFADAMVYLDKSVPDMQKACKTALADARAESAERAARTPVAETMLREIFGGVIPDNIRFHVAGLRNPSDLDVIRVDIRYKDGWWGSNYQVDIPLDLPKECYHYLPEMIQGLSDSEPYHWYVEPFYDDETGWIPILGNRATLA